MPLTDFGPFAAAFDTGRGVPGYLTLLSLSGAYVQVVMDRIDRALAAGDPSPWVRALLDDANWRPHLVGAVSLLLDDANRVQADSLWQAIDGGSWVVPQLVVTAYFVDGAFADRLRSRVAQGCPVVPASGLSPLARHIATGPNSTIQRSAKLLGSLAFVGRRVPSLVSWIEDACSTPELRALLAQDVDNAPGIARRWLQAVESQFTARGRKLKPCYLR